MSTSLVASPLATDVFPTSASYLIDAGAKSLVLTLAGGATETYAVTLANGPDPGLSLVKAAEQDVLHDMSLAEIATHLDRAVDLMFVAYCGVGGTGPVEASVSDRQIELLNLTGTVLSTMQSFKDNSSDIVSRITEGFGYLFDANEARAMKILSHCAQTAQIMADASAALSVNFADLGTRAQKSMDLTIDAKGVEVSKLADLRKKMSDMSATLDAQRKLQDQLQVDQAATDALYRDAKDEEEEDSKRQFWGQVIGGVTQAIGAGVAAYAAAGTPKLNINTGSTTSQPETPANPSPAETPDETAKKAAVTQAQLDVANAQAAIDVAQANIDAADKRSAELTAQKNAADPKDVPDLASQIDAAEKDKAEATAAKAAATEKLKTAQDSLKSSQAALAALGAVLSKAGETADKIASDAKTAGESAHQQSMLLLNHKFDLEKQKREALAQVAELTENLKYTTAEQTIDQATLDALQISVWAFAQLTATFATLKSFWDSMARACLQLKGDRLMERITEEMDDKDESREDRIKYYLSDRFFFSVVVLVVRWVAMREICSSYVAEVEKIRAKSDGKVRTSPSIAQGRQLLPQLRDDIADKLNLDKLNSEARSQKIQEAMKLLAEKGSN